MTFYSYQSISEVGAPLRIFDPEDEFKNEPCERLVQLFKRYTCEQCEKTDPQGRNHLMLACKFGRRYYLTELGKKGARLNAVDKNGWTAVRHAVGCLIQETPKIDWAIGALECLRWLLLRGANPSLPDCNKITPLFALCKGLSDKSQGMERLQRKAIEALCQFGASYQENGVEVEEAPVELYRAKVQYLDTKTRLFLLGVRDEKSPLAALPFDLFQLILKRMILNVV